MFFAYEEITLTRNFYLILAGIRLKKLHLSQTYVMSNYILRSSGGLSYQDFTAV